MSTGRGPTCLHMVNAAYRQRPFCLHGRSGRSPAPDTAFTLIEMLTVMAIIIVILGMTVPVVGPILKGRAVTEAAQIVSAQMSQARQTALAHNRTVELRFYKFADLEASGESVSNPATWKVRAMQSFEITPAGTSKALNNVQRFPKTVIVDSGTKLSSLLDPTANPSVGGTPSQLIPGAGANYSYQALRFRPDGSTTLVSTGNWFVTAHSLEVGDGLGAPPNNFATMQIDPVQGSVTTYRP